MALATHINTQEVLIIIVCIICAGFNIKVPFYNSILIYRLTISFETVKANKMVGYIKICRNWIRLFVFIFDNS